jgi:hypothetical protein
MKGSVAIRQGLHLIERDGHIPRHADLIGFSPLYSVLDVKGLGVTRLGEERLWRQPAFSFSSGT